MQISTKLAFDRILYYIICIGYGRLSKKKGNDLFAKRICNTDKYRSCSLLKYKERGSNVANCESSVKRQCKESQILVMGWFCDCSE